MSFSVAAAADVVELRAEIRALSETLEKKDLELALLSREVRALRERNQELESQFQRLERFTERCLDAFRRTWHYMWNRTNFRNRWHGFSRADLIHIWNSWALHHEERVLVLLSDLENGFY